MQLPKTLDREPLVDAVFEVRMRGAPHLSDLLPGALYGQLEPKPVLQRLPAAEIPQPIREQDPNLSSAPVIRLDWGQFTISFGDRNLIISCKLPYPKWPAFKNAIIDIIQRVSSFGIPGTIERYSLKYVNLIQAPTISEQISKINMSVRIGSVEANSGHLSIQVHDSDKDTLHLMSVVTGAEGTMPDGTLAFGTIVDIDSIRMQHFESFLAFSKEIGSAVESLRQENKRRFFSCLTDATIEDMGPNYD